MSTIGPYIKEDHHIADENTGFPKAMPDNDHGPSLQSLYFWIHILNSFKPASF